MKSKKRNVLLVDDDPVSNFINERILQSIEMIDKIHSVFNGREALRILDRPLNSSFEAPDIILLDLNMPVMNGFEFIESFNGLDFLLKQKILIVILTSSNSQDDMRRAESLGMKYFITKPVRLENIQSIIKEEFNDESQPSNNDRLEE